MEELPLTLKHMYQAEYIVRNSLGLFTGQVQEPSYMLMDHDDQMNAWRVLMESTEWDTKEHFTFISENIQDMETFMIFAETPLNLRVNAGRAHVTHIQFVSVCECIWVTVHPTHCLLVCVRVSDNVFSIFFLISY